jgi:hypothetical protein
MDSDHSGTVTKEEIHAAFSNYGIQVVCDLIDRILLKIDFDGDGSIALDELANFFTKLEPAELPGLGGNLIWDGIKKRTVNKEHKKAASINSDVIKDDTTKKKDGVIVDVTESGGFIADLGTGAGQSIDLLELVSRSRTCRASRGLLTLPPPRSKTKYTANSRRTSSSMQSVSLVWPARMTAI